MIYFINKHKQNKAILRQATKSNDFILTIYLVMRNLQKPVEFHTEIKDACERNQTDKCFSTDLEEQMQNRLLDISVSSEEEYSEFTKNSNIKILDKDKDNDNELLKNVNNEIKANFIKPQEKPRLSVNHSAHVLE